ncbi:MAG: hypothetical protein ACJ790_00550 [Myxococcaceae bacterium]
MFSLVTAALLLQQVPVVKAPNDGPVRVYLATQTEACQEAQGSLAALGLTIDSADTSRITATLPPGTRKGGALDFTAGRKYTVSCTEKKPGETEVAIAEERRFDQEYGGVNYVSEFHAGLAERIAALRVAKRPPPEVDSPPVIQRASDLKAQGTKFPGVKVTPLSRQGNVVAAFDWELSGAIPAHYSPSGERTISVMQGAVKVQVGKGEPVVLNVDDTIKVPKGARLSIAPAKGTAKLLVVELPAGDLSSVVWVNAADAGNEWANPYATH